MGTFPGSAGLSVPGRSLSNWIRPGSVLRGTGARCGCQSMQVSWRWQPEGRAETITVQT
jgi:hypothetical protein